MEIKGIITAMLTPFDEQQNVNYEATRILVNKLIDAGVDGLFILGTNGEFHLMDQEEKIEFAKVVIEEANKRVPVYVGAGGNSTREVVALSKKMEVVGADALSVITPYFVPPTQAELIDFYKDIAGAVSIPIVMYNMPGKTGINIDPQTLKELANVDNIVGIKDSSGQLENMKAYIDVTKNLDFAVLSGSDSLILDVLNAGGTGAVAATSNLLAPIVVSIYRHWLAKDQEAARKAQERIEPLRGVLKLGTIPSVLKKAVEFSGIPVGPPRSPVSESTGEALVAIKEVVEEYQKECNIL